MASVADALAGASAPIHDALAAGLDVLGQRETAAFTPYVRTVLPVDGFVFWLNAALLSPAQLAVHGLSSAAQISIDGTLHYASQGVQAEDETIVVRRVEFTAEEQVTAFAEIAPDVLYVGTWATGAGSFRFTFGARGAYFVQADLHHYVGDAIYPVFEAQLIDDIAAFDERPVVSNSLPLWLAMLSAQVYPSPLQPPDGLQLYPAFLVPQNLVPPYGAVDILPERLRPLQSIAWRDRTQSRWQLVAETVRLHLYGLRSDDVMDLLDYIVQYSELSGAFGIMNMPVPRDDRRPQIELAALAQKKTIEFEINYYQTRMRDLARQVFKTIVPSWIPSSDPVAPAP
ncbi:MAG TPA: hypothetical protein VGR91_16400, partial [Stellaceae bacterium]|nr:hypothetical protein [Stellaceae bacterium]